MELQKSNNFLYKHSYLIFLYAYVILVCKAMVTCYKIVDFNYLHVSLLFLSGIIIYRLYFILTLKISIKTAVYLLLLSALVLLLIFNLNHLKPLWDNFIVQNFYRINQGIYYGSETYYYQFLPFLIMLIPIISAACYALSSRGYAVFSIFLMSIFMFSFWNNGLDRFLTRYIPCYIFLSLSYYSVSKYDKLVRKFSNTNIKVTVRFNTIFLYALILSVSVTLAAVASSHILGVKSIVQLKNDYAGKEARLAFAVRKSAFDLANTFYSSENGKLGGPIQINNLPALKVKADRPMYLRGTVEDYYDGHSWSKSFDDFVIKGLEALIVPDNNFNFRMTGHINKKPDTRKMYIYNYSFATSTLFTPNNTISINTKEGKVMYDSSHTFMLAKDDTVNESYILEYYISSTGIENFNEINGTDYSISYEPGSYDEAKLEYYRNNVLKPFKAYLQVPQSITSRTYELVSEITKNCRTAEEKAEKIMSYLSRSYPYSLNVSQVPDDTDFVDYFLFSERKGYCTYFATAASIMCRIAGIPARYVEGFNMDEEKGSDGLYVVRNNRAHAWTEILVSPESNLWCIVDCVPQGVSSNEISNSSQYRDKFADDRYKYSDNRYSNLETGKTNTSSIWNYASLLSVLLYPLFLIPAVILLLLTIYIIYKLVKFKKMTAKLLTEESTIPLYKHLATRLKSIGEDFPEGLCELEYVRSLKDKKLSECLEKIIIECYAEHYGNINNHKTIDKKACNLIIENYARRKQGFLKYWYYRIIYSQVKKKIL